MSATRRTQLKQSQSPTWEEIETLLARELKVAYGGRLRGMNSLAKTLRNLRGINRKFRTRRRRV
jgi:hypothetical protein